jgi:outer membrane protein OmpA-like peptidoglycan-associated protein
MAQTESGQKDQTESGKKQEIHGLITTRSGDSLTVQTKKGEDVVVNISDQTKVEQPKGVFRHKEMGETALIPGLEVKVKGVADEKGQINAEYVRFSAESLKRTQQIQAHMTTANQQIATNQQGVAENQQAHQKNAQGIAANQEKVEANQADIEAANKRFEDLSEWDTKDTATMNFPTGSSQLTDEGKAALTKLSEQSKTMKGYLIEVKGFASTSGDVKKNQDLSDDRADAVVAFLHQAGVPLRHIVTPAAMGTTEPVATNDTTAGREQNQRVEVKLLTNRGVASAK